MVFAGGPYNIIMYSVRVLIWKLVTPIQRIGLGRSLVLKTKYYDGNGTF